MPRHPTLWGHIRPARHKRDGTCSHCPAPRDIAHRYCKSCRALYMRLYRKRPKHEPAHSEQRSA